MLAWAASQNLLSIRGSSKPGREPDTTRLPTADGRGGCCEHACAGQMPVGLVRLLFGHSVSGGARVVPHAGRLRSIRAEDDRRV